MIALQDSKLQEQHSRVLPARRNTHIVLALAVTLISGAFTGAAASSKHAPATKSVHAKSAHRPRKGSFSNDSAQILVNKFFAARDTIERQRIRKQLQRVPTEFMEPFVKRLKANVMEKGDSVAGYARLLAGYDSVREFNASGKYNVTFDIVFFQKIVMFLTHTTETSSRDAADFLRALQDARAINPTMKLYEGGGISPLAKHLCIAVLGSFSTSSDAMVKMSLKNWFSAKASEESDKEMKVALMEAANRF